MSNLEQIYEAVMELKQSMGRVETGIRTQMTSMDKHVSDDDLVEKRVAALEHGRAHATGFIAAVSALVAAPLASFLTYFINSHK